MFADSRCGLGFEMEEFLIEENGNLFNGAPPVEECTVKMARTRKDFVKKDAEQGIHWDFENILMKSLVRLRRVATGILAASRIKLRALQSPNSKDVKHRRKAMEQEKGQSKSRKRDQRGHWIGDERCRCCCLSYSE